jgi:hypothetical protein
MSNLNYTVGSLRAEGLEAKWTKTSAGAPIIVARTKPGNFYAISDAMFGEMLLSETQTVREIFESHTLLGDIFSVAI